MSNSDFHRSAGSDRALLAALVHDAMRFAIWAAGEGITPVDGQPARAPEDFLYEYSCATDIEDWDGLAEVARDAVTGDVAQPSVEAMKAAVELEIHAALGRVQTVEIGRMIQKAIDASQPSPAATVEPKDRPFFECPGCGKDIAETDQPHAADCPRAAHSSAANGDDCAHRIAVTPRNGAPHGAGFACSLSGGHCIAKPGCGYQSINEPQGAGK